MQLSVNGLLTDNFAIRYHVTSNQGQRTPEQSIASEHLRSVLWLFDPLLPTRAESNPFAEAIHHSSDHIPRRSPKLTPVEAFIRPSLYQRTSTLIYVPIPILDSMKHSC